MKSDWKRGIISDFALVKGGKRLPKGINLISSPNNHPYIRVRDLNNKRTLEVDSDFEYVDDITQKSISNYIVEKNDIVLSIVGTIGLTAKIGKSLDKANLTENCVKLASIKNIDTDFLFYYLRSPYGQNEIKKGTVGAVQAKLPIKNIQAIPIFYPPIETQRNIANILRTIDDKIELNIAINNNLLELLILLYTELNQRDSWQTIKINNIAEKIAMGPFGSNIKVSTFVTSGIPIISGNHLRGYFLEEPSFNYITEEHAEKLKNSIVYPKDIIFTHAGNIGQVAMIPSGSKYQKYIISQRQFYLRCNQELALPEYVTMFFHSKQGQHELLGYANQTGVPSIAQPATNLKKIELQLPPIEIQKQWLRSVSPIIDKYQKNRYENEYLMTIRDSLLPKLMSGEIDVSEIEI